MYALTVLIAMHVSAVAPETEFQEKQITFTGGEYKDEVFKYRLLEPLKIEAGKKYPLVLFLHGAGERGNDNVTQLLYLPTQMCQPEWREKYPCYLLAPQCRSDKKWVNVPWVGKASQPQPEVSEQMLAAVQMLEKTLKEHPIDVTRIYLTGLSMGGYGSWDLAMRMPERFAAVAPICGGGDNDQAAKLVGMPIWVWHGDADNAVPVERSRTMIEAIKKAGGNPKYTELKGVGHNCWTPAYGNPDGVVPWMFEQRKKS
jgi:predicted peptidase